MRSFADALPVLRDMTSAAPLPVMRDGARFDPGIAVRALTSGSARLKTAPARFGTDAPDEDQTDVADIRRELLRRQAEDGEAATASASPRRFAPPPLADDARHHRTAGAIPDIDDEASRVEDRIAEAVAKAKLEAETPRACAVELARQVERDVAARGIAEARQRWCEEEAVAFHKRCDAAFESLHARLSEAFGRVVAPIAEASIRDAAVRRFAAVVDDLLSTAPDGPPVTVRGPADLIRAMRQASAKTSVAFEEQTADAAAELVVTIGETQVQTTVAAWAETLATALGHGYKEQDVGGH